MQAGRGLRPGRGLALGIAAVLGLGLGCRPAARRGADLGTAADLGASRPAVAPAALGAVVRGVVRAGGAPQRGVRVRIGTAGRTRSVETDAEGRFELADVAPGAYALSAVAPGGTLGAMLPVDVRLGEEAAASGDGGQAERTGAVELVVELVPLVRLSGVVRDADGHPLAGAFVRVEEEERPLPVEVETGADGAFAIAERVRGRSYRVNVRRAGFVPEGPRTVKAGGPALEVRLRRGATLVGRVVDDRGAPVAGAELGVIGEDGGGAAGPGAMIATGVDDGWARLEPSGELGVLRNVPYPPLPAPLAPVAPVPAIPTGGPVAPGGLRSDARGEFRVAELVPGQIIVTARHPDFAAAASVPVVVAPGATRTVQIVLVRGTLLRGRTLDERGAGLGDVQVTSSDGRTAISDAAGRFQLEHVVGALRLVARRPGYLKAEGQVEGDADRRELGVDLTLRRALGRLGGQVVDARGNPVEGARLTITPSGGEAVHATGDRGGRFLVEGLPDGPYRVLVEHPGWPSLRLGAVEATSDARLVLEVGGGIEGELLDARTGAPPPGARLDVILDGERRPVVLDGRRFRVTGLPTGPARLVARAPGYPRLERLVEVLAADRAGEVTVRDLRLELELGGELRGRVRDDRGDPVAGAEVEIEGSAQVDPVRSGSDGGFTLSGVPSGRVRVRARAGTRTGVEEVEVRANETSRVDLTLAGTR